MTPRPRTLRQLAERSDSLDEFGRHFQDWLHTVRTFRSRPQVLAAVRETPPPLGRRFPDGGIADAWLAAYAEHASHLAGQAAPPWSERRISPRPWFAVAAGDTPARLRALRDSPASFKSRNLFTPEVEWPLRLAAGRPAKSPEELRRANAARQRRFRQRRRAELLRLRASA